MKPEELFQAIGSVEESRLARSELSLSSPEKKEDKNMKVTPTRIIRNVLIAAVLVSLLAVTAYAVTGFLIYESPEEMVAAIFGDDTGFDHSEGSITRDPMGSPESILVEPTFDRVPADETVVAQDIAPKVNVVGQSVSAKGYTVTVDAFLYDSTTKCGVLTYLLENPNGLPEYNLQTTGEIWYPGMPDPVQINYYGYPYIIQEKTTDTCLAVSYYFMAEDRHGKDLQIGLHESIRYTPEEQAARIAEAEKKLRQQMTEEDVLALLEDNMGKELLDRLIGELGKAALLEQAWPDLAAAEAGKMTEEGEMITVPLDQLTALEQVTAGDGSIIITPISFFLDVRPHEFLHTDSVGNRRITSDNADSIVIRYRDGSEYIVMDNYIINTMFALGQYPEGTTQTEHFVSPEEDPNGEGFSYIEMSQPCCLLTVAFNRIVDVEAVQAVIINGVELPID